MPKYYPSINLPIMKRLRDVPSTFLELETFLGVEAWDNQKLSNRLYQLKRDGYIDLKFAREMPDTTVNKELRQRIEEERERKKGRPQGKYTYWKYSLTFLGEQALEMSPDIDLPDPPTNPAKTERTHDLTILGQLILYPWSTSELDKRLQLITNVSVVLSRLKNLRWIESKGRPRSYRWYITDAGRAHFEHYK